MGPFHHARHHHASEPTPPMCYPTLYCHPTPTHLVNHVSPGAIVARRGAGHSVQRGRPGVVARPHHLWRRGHPGPHRGRVCSYHHGLTDGHPAAAVQRHAAVPLARVQWTPAPSEGCRGACVCPHLCHSIVRGVPPGSLLCVPMMCGMVGSWWVVVAVVGRVVLGVAAVPVPVPVPEAEAVAVAFRRNTCPFIDDPPSWPLGVRLCRWHWRGPRGSPLP